MITLVAVLCHAVSGVPACVDEVVSSYTAEAGKVDSPVEMPAMTWGQCQMEGQQVIAKWMSEHPIYHASYWLKEWKCVPGKYISSNRA